MGGTTPRPDRDTGMDLQLARAGLLAGDPGITAACAPGAVTALGDGPAAGAFQLGQEAVALLDRHARPVPLLLLRRTAAAALTSGDGPPGDALLERRHARRRPSAPMRQARWTGPGSWPAWPATS